MDCFLKRNQLNYSPKIHKDQHIKIINSNFKVQNLLSWRNLTYFHKLILKSKRNIIKANLFNQIQRKHKKMIQIKKWKRKIKIKGLMRIKTLLPWNIQSKNQIKIQVKSYIIKVLLQKWLKNFMIWAQKELQQDLKNKIHQLKKKI